VGFVRKWIEAIRASADPRLRGASLLVRPHPQNAGQWRDVDLPSEYAQVAVWPKAGVNPIGGSARADYYHSMYFSRAVVGINTSAQIESGIVGRPVYSVVTEEFAGTQEGTLHFQHLKNVDGGLLHLSDNLSDHVAQLTALLLSDGGQDDKARRFVEAFVRPHGLDVAATPRLVDELERFAALPAPAPRTVSPGDRLLRRVLVPAAVLATALTVEREKFRSMVLHWTRPMRLRVRGVVSQSRYAARSVVHLLVIIVRFVRRTIRRLLFPVRWTMRRVRVLAAIALARGTGRTESDRVP
jgi:hypothetical protein